MLKSPYYEDGDAKSQNIFIAGFSLPQLASILDSQHIASGWGIVWNVAKMLLAETVWDTMV
jgi:hypothetical protein